MMLTLDCTKYRSEVKHLCCNI